MPSYINATDRVKTATGYEPYVCPLNRNAAISLDWEAQDWWGSDYSKFLEEIQGYEEEGWAVRVLRKRDALLIAVLLLPERVPAKEEECLSR